jgi:hypothetical protein
MHQKSRHGNTRAYNNNRECDSCAHGAILLKATGYKACVVGNTEVINVLVVHVERVFANYEDTGLSSFRRAPFTSPSSYRFGNPTVSPARNRATTCRAISGDTILLESLSNVPTLTAHHLWLSSPLAATKVTVSR